MATSVAQKLDRIAQIDPRVRIVWEDCGAFPYAYLAENVAHARETEDFTRKFSHLREHGATGVVTKGMICLDWTDFVHRAGPERIGECSAGKSPHASPSRAGSCALRRATGCKTGLTCKAL